jgi:ABC-type transport system involved in multi-copper enzyme maturation permease subunit
VRSLYLIYSLARADFLERARRSSYLLTLGFAVYLAVAVYTGKIVLRLNEYRGVPNSAWFGSSMQLVCIVFMSLFGFYIAKNGIQRDEQTRVGRILAATPMSKSLYIVGKATSNFVVLASVVLVLALGAALMPLLQERTGTDYGALVFPFFVVALPCMAFVGALAVFFESLPLLRGGAGNVVYFFLWSGLLGLGIGAKTTWLDFPASACFSGIWMQPCRKWLRVISMDFS